MRYDRRYPHPIELEFEAASTGEQLDAWLLPVSRVDRRRAFKFDVLRVADGTIAEITTFDPHLFPAFGLPLILRPLPFRAKGLDRAGARGGGDRRRSG